MKVVLITGGSRGIGRAIVEEFSRAGYGVAFTYAKDRKAADDLAASLSTGEHPTLAFQAEVRDFDRAQDVAKQAAEALGPVDVLVNNAGIRRDGALHNMDPAVWHEVIDTNLTGTFNYTRAVIRAMIRRGGVILNISSVSGSVGMAGQTNYSASKAGMIGFTRALSREVGRFGIRVNAIAPGVIDTEIIADLGPRTREKLHAQIPAGRSGTPREVAKLVLYLASDDAAYATGQVFTLDGGLS